MGSHAGLLNPFRAQQAARPVDHRTGVPCGRQEGSSGPLKSDLDLATSLPGIPAGLTQCLAQIFAISGLQALRAQAIRPKAPNPIRNKASFEGSGTGCCTPDEKIKVNPLGASGSSVKVGSIKAKNVPGA